MTSYHFCLYVASDFFEGPTIVGAYLVTELSVKIVNSLGQESATEESKEGQLSVLFDSFVKKKNIIMIADQMIARYSDSLLCSPNRGYSWIS
jgi:lipocalin